MVFCFWQVNLSHFFTLFNFFDDPPIAHQFCSFNLTAKLFSMGLPIVKKPGRGAGEGKIFYTLSWGKKAWSTSGDGNLHLLKPEEST
jgi:hypothetical protein